jgi:cytochrome c oxidase subunit 2
MTKHERIVKFGGAALIALAMLVTGCGDKKEESKPSSTATTTSSTSSSTSSGTSAQATASSGDEQVVKVVGQNYEWKLDKTEVKKGKPVKLVVTSEQGFHGLTIDGTPVNNVQAMNGKENSVTFTPEKAGDLKLVCSIMCGTGHDKMVATLKVVE